MVTGEGVFSPAAPAAVHEEEMPRVHLTRRRVIAGALFVLSAIGFFYFVLPQISNVGSTVHRIEGGNSWWIAVGVVLEALSFGAYVLLFQAVFVRGEQARRIGWRESYLITMAGVVATRLLATAGAGGVALTAWALRRSGMEARLVACRMVAFMVLLYVVYAGSLVLAGVGLASGLLPTDPRFRRKRMRFLRYLGERLSSNMILPGAGRESAFDGTTASGKKPPAAMDDNFEL